MKLAQSSDDPLQDTAALKAVEDACPLPPLPGNVPDADIQFTFDTLTDKMMLDGHLAMMSKNGQLFVYDRTQAFTASFSDGKWTKGLAFSYSELQGNFVQVKNPALVYRMIYIAQNALSEHKTVSH